MYLQHRRDQECDIRRRSVACREAGPGSVGGARNRRARRRWRKLMPVMLEPGAARVSGGRPVAPTGRRYRPTRRPAPPHGTSGRDPARVASGYRFSRRTTESTSRGPSIDRRSVRRTGGVGQGAGTNGRRPRPPGRRTRGRKPRCRARGRSGTSGPVGSRATRRLQPPGRLRPSLLRVGSGPCIYSTAGIRNVTSGVGVCLS